MRSFFSLLTFFVLALPVFAQRNANQVNLTIVGNKDLRLLVDGRDQALSNPVITGNSSSGNLERLNNGQHTLQISRTNLNTNKMEQVNASFTLRRGYDLDITVTGTGALEMIESRAGRNDNDNPVMSTVNFNNLLRTVRSQRNPQQRNTFVSNAFNNSDYSFTVNQVDQLLQLIDGETSRLPLVKQSYRSVNDPENFYLLYYMFNASNKNELYSYVDNYDTRGGGRGDGNGGNGGGGYGGGRRAMNDQEFTSLLNVIKQQWPPSTQENSITDAFNNTNKYYSVGQALQLIQLVNSESSRLRLAKLSYRGIVDRNNFYQVVDLLSFQSSKDQLNSYVTNYKDDVGGGNNNDYAMSESDYNRLYESVKSQWPPSTQVNTVKAAFNNLNYFFTAAQVSKLLRLFSFEGDKLDLAKVSYRGIVDRNNMSQVFDVLSFQTSKDNLTAFIRNYKDDNNNNGGGRNPVSDSKFNDLKQNVQTRIFPGEKMSALQDIFSDNSYYFTSNQAKQLIELLSLESNRLTLAKLAYRNITDRNNFSQVSNLLFNQNSRQQLDEYVRNYRD